MSDQEIPVEERKCNMEQKSRLSDTQFRPHHPFHTPEEWVAAGRAAYVNPRREPGTYDEPGETQIGLHPRDFGERPMQTRKTVATETYEYSTPFKYENILVDLGRCRGGDPESRRGEFNYDGCELDVPPYGAITITEDKPIVAVTVIGSACVSPGYVMLIGEPTEWTYPRSGVKMMVSDLWGQHITAHVWNKGVDEGEAYLLPGMSAARFDLPDCRKVTIQGGSKVIPVNTLCDADAHYLFRIIRVTVRTDA